MAKKISRSVGKGSSSEIDKTRIASRLRQAGLSHLGATQVASAQILTSASDREMLVKLLESYENQS